MENNNNFIVNHEDEGNNKIAGIVSMTRFCTNSTSKRFIKKVNDFTYLEIDKITVSKIEFTLTKKFYLLSNGNVFMRIPSHSNNINEKERDILEIKEKRETLIEKERAKHAKGGNTNLRDTPFEAMFFQLHTKLDINLFFIDISAGDNHLLLLDNSFNVWGYGCNKYNQINKSKENYYPFLIKIEKIGKVKGIYALKNTSLVITYNNDIYIWGSVQENYIPKVKESKETKKVKIISSFVKRDDLVTAINKAMRNYPGLILDEFILTHKLLGTHFNSIILSNKSIEDDIKSLQKKVNNTLSDFNHKFQEYHKLTNESKKVIKIKILVDLGNKLYNKLQKRNQEREYFYEVIETINEEIQQIKNDFENSLNKLNIIDKEIEDIVIRLNVLTSKNENVETKSKKEREKKKIEIFQKNKKIEELNKKIEEKESVQKIIKLQYDSFEEKSDEKLTLLNSITESIEKENLIYKKRFLVEDMIKILKMLDKKSSFSKTKSNVVLQSVLQEKNKENLKALLYYMQKLEALSFFTYNLNNPYKTIKDIINECDSSLSKLKKDFLVFKDVINESSFQNFSFLINLIENKIKKIFEQNHLISSIYHSLSEYKVEQIKKYFESYFDNNSFEWCLNQNIRQALFNNKEYLIKEIIHLTISDTFDPELEQNMEKKLKKLEMSYTEQKFKKNLENYIKENKKIEKRLQNRNNIIKETKINDNYLRNLKTYSYKTNNQTKEKSLWDWFGGVFQKK